MFCTVPNAEQFTPGELVPKGERIWRYVEFQLQVPLFLVAVRDDHSELTRHFLFSELTDVIELASQQDDKYAIDGVKLLSPAHMNRSGGYELGSLKEIWRDKDVPVNHVFVMSDGSRHKFELVDQRDDEQTLDLVLAI